MSSLETRRLSQPSAPAPATAKFAPIRELETSVAPFPGEVEATPARGLGAVQWLRVSPFLGLHALCFLALWVGVSPAAGIVCAASYVLRMFAITGFYHRYFSHRAFKTSRFMQFVFAAWGGTSAQRGALWWAAHHRRHHVHSDQDRDVHSPIRSGFFWSHMGWFMTNENHGTDYDRIRDLARFPELRFLNRHDWLMPIALICACYALGALAPASWNTSGLQMVVWGFVISTVLLFHGTSTINSLAHLIGRRRFKTKDESRNNFALALITMGEGWHNNHHHYPVSARQGFVWWEIDLTYYGLRLMACLGLIRELRPVPARVFAKENLETHSR